MDRKRFSEVLDEAVSQLDSEVRVLKNQKVTLSQNIKELDSRRDELSAKILSLEKKHAETMKEFKISEEAAVSLIKDKLENANIKEAKAVSALSDLNKKLKDADNLIKSNHGLQSNLLSEKDALKKKVAAISELFSQVSDIIKSL